MFTTIVVGTDGSPNARKALQVAADLAGMNPDCTVHVVTAARPLTEPELREAVASVPDEFSELINSHFEGQANLDNARPFFASTKINTEYHEIDGDPAEAILDVVDKYNADLVVVGSRGEKLPQRMLHGSVSTKLIHHVPCSALIVKLDS